MPIMKLVSFIIYIPLQILFLPFTILGGLLVAYKQLMVSKKLDVSQSAVEVINGRWAMHVFGIRDDVASVRLASVMPNNSVFGLWLCLFPLWIKYKVSGAHFLYPRIPARGSETLVDLIVARTLYFDHIIDRTIPQVEQFVILGAGYDMRAYGSFKSKELVFFEVDQASVQKHKQASLESAGIAFEHVSFVTVDFEKELVFDKLLESGFDPAKKTLFLWEGVTLYLSEADVRKTIQEIRSRAAIGSVVILDLYSERFLAKFKSGQSKKVLEFANEGFDFSFDFSTNYEEELTLFLKSESMSVGETFFLGSDSDKGPIAVVVEMKCE